MQNVTKRYSKSIWTNIREYKQYDELCEKIKKSIIFTIDKLKSKGNTTSKKKEDNMTRVRLLLNKITKESVTPITKLIQLEITNTNDKQEQDEIYKIITDTICSNSFFTDVYTKLVLNLSIREKLTYTLENNIKMYKRKCHHELDTYDIFCEKNKDNDIMKTTLKLYTNICSTQCIYTDLLDMFRIFCESYIENNGENICTMLENEIFISLICKNKDYDNVKKELNAFSKVLSNKLKFRIMDIMDSMYIINSYK
jgi:hypothetical protein